MNFTQDQSETQGHIRKGLQWYNVLIPFLVVLLTVLAFLPALQNGFVDWDDDANFLENPFYRGLSWDNLRWMFTTVYLSNYRPLTWMTFGLDYLVWGMNPFGYHLTSLFLHGINALLVYFLALRLLSLAGSVQAASHEVQLRVAAAYIFYSSTARRTRRLVVREEPFALGAFLFVGDSMLPASRREFDSHSATVALVRCGRDPLWLVIARTIERHHISVDPARS
jgi:hypothetical protein